MSKADLAYDLHRESTETDFARNATHSAARSAHLELAAAYHRVVEWSLKRIAVPV